MDVSTQASDGAVSQNTQTFEINITSLPTGRIQIIELLKLLAEIGLTPAGLSAHPSDGCKHNYLLPSVSFNRTLQATVCRWRH